MEAIEIPDPGAEIKYPGVSDRVKAITLDSAFIILLMFIITYLFSFFPALSDNYRIAAFLILLLYEPVSITLYGGTIGHMAIGIRVKKERDYSKNISFPQAMVRFFFKIVLGWFSLFAVSLNAKRRAVHDVIAGSIVVFAKPG